MNGVDLVKDTYIPIFTNKPGDYKEWRQRILLYKRKSDLKKKQKEAAINLMTSLSGIAWKQIEGIAEKAAEADDGFMMILTELDKTFKYDDQVEMPRAFERFFFGLHQREGQTMINNYVADHREALAEDEKHGISIAGKVAGWPLHWAEANGPRTCICVHPDLSCGSPLLPVRPRLQGTCQRQQKLGIW